MACNPPGNREEGSPRGVRRTELREEQQDLSDFPECGGRIWRMGPRPPRLLRRSEPRLPGSGHIVVRIVVLKSGDARFLEVVRGPRGPAVESVLEEALKHWRFEPATLQGEPVCIYYLQTMTWR